ncbi:MAG: NAD(P)H-binding protein [Candidatus Neomarinimicrobiota bacterium]
MKPVLVLGGTGHYGRHIVYSLRARHETVRVLTRNLENARALLDARVELAAGDITDPAATQKALTDARALIISISAFNPRQIRRLREIEYEAVLRVLREAQDAGIERVVFISVYDIREDILARVNRQFAAVARYKKAIEEYLQHSGFNWTVLGAPPAMDMFFAFIRGDKMMVPGGGPPALPTVATADVGEIAAQSVLRSDLAGMRLRMTGPAAYSFSQAAEIIGEISGKTLAIRKIPQLPIRIASVLAWPFTPYLRYLAGSVQMLNLFPQDLAAAVPADHRRLQELFDYNPVTLADEARRRFGKIE